MLVKCELIETFELNYKILRYSKNSVNMQSYNRDITIVILPNLSNFFVFRDVGMGNQKIMDYNHRQPKTT